MRTRDWRRFVAYCQRSLWARDSAERPPRPRGRTLISIALVIPLGLLTRSGLPMPGVILAYGGDTLYATLVYLLVALVWPRATARRLGLIAFGLCVAVELSQLIHTPWLDALRATTPGRLALGSGFLWSDLACYAAGALLGALLDALRRP